MKTIALTLLVCSLSLLALPQNINITFTGTGAATNIDSVKATNLNTSGSVTLPGNDTLVLIPNTGIPAITNDIAYGVIFPNPFMNMTTLITGVTESQTVYLKVQNLVGQIITQTETFLNPGDHRFNLSTTAEGIYLVSLTTNQGTTGYKVICTGSSGSGNSIQYSGAMSFPGHSKFKSGPTGYTLGYAAGEIIRYLCWSGNFTAIFTDSPLESKNYEVAFAPIARFTIDPQEGTTENTFVLDASDCSDAETLTADLEVRWDFDGDGTWDTDYDKSKVINHQYSLAKTYSVRLEVKDASGLTDMQTHSFTVTYATFTDSRDGNIYPYKTIGGQVWMIRNLAHLPTVSPSSLGSETTPYYYVYDYEGDSVAEAKTVDNYATYGVLYNYKAAKNACPSGWHLPSDHEWVVLEMFLGMSKDAADSSGLRSSGAVGGKLKESGTTHWSRYCDGTIATNSSGFTALPGGERYYYDFFQDPGLFQSLHTGTYFWSSTLDGDLQTWARSLDCFPDGISRGPYNHGRAFSVRCIRN